jgi:RimJ/RimL family protein N-acetyltransferase
MAGKQILETERLVLREFDEGDVAAFYVLGTDPAIIRYTGDPPGGMTSLEDALEVLRSRPLADYSKYGYGRWACVDKASGVVIGFAGLKYLTDLDEVDIGFRLLPAYWGQGLATEASRAVVEYARKHFHLDEIIGLVDLANVASARVLDKVGFTRLGMMQYHGDDVVRYVLRLARDACDQK